MMLKLGSAFFVLLLISQVSAHGLQSQPSVEILIPKGMPITIDVQRDRTEMQILKYVFVRHAKGAHRARITIAMLDENGTIKFKRSTEGDHLNEPMTIATADTSVARVLLIVEWLETDKGKWVLDKKAEPLDIPSLAKQGIKTLPKATFFPK
jgi:hypothetical protein